MTGHEGHALPFPSPPLGVADLLLRPWTPGDAPHLAAAWADPEIACWTGVPPMRDEATARRWIDGDPARRVAWASLDLVVERAGRVAGEVGLAAIDRSAGTAEIGWWTAASERGEGVASAAATLLATWALAPHGLGLRELVAVCAEVNPASGAVAGRAGFTLSSRPSSPGQVTWIRTAAGAGTVHP